MIPRDRWGTRGRHRSPVSPGSPRTTHTRLNLAPSVDGEHSVGVTTPASGLDDNDWGHQVAWVDSTPCFFGALLLRRPHSAFIRDSVHPAYLRPSFDSREFGRASWPGCGGDFRGPAVAEAWAGNPRQTRRTLRPGRDGTWPKALSRAGTAIPAIHRPRTPAGNPVVLAGDGIDNLARPGKLRRCAPP